MCLVLLVFFQRTHNCVYMFQIHSHLELLFSPLSLTSIYFSHLEVNRFESYSFSSLAQPILSSLLPGQIAV